MLVGGMCAPQWQTAGGFGELADVLKSAGYDEVLTFHYTGSQDLRYGPVDELDRALTRRVETNAKNGTQTRIVLVGQSLGANLSFELIQKYILPGNFPADGQVVQVMALQAPLHGYPPGLLNELLTTLKEHRVPLGGIECIFSKNLRLLEARFSQEPQTNEELKALVRTAQTKGIRITTWGSSQDCLYNLRPCLGPLEYVVPHHDVSSTQIIDMPEASPALLAVGTPCSLSISQCFMPSHSALLRERAHAIADHLGPPLR
jgi:hypothetical protein